VLSQFFYFASGTTMMAAILLAMRLVARERSSGCLILLNTSPVRDLDIILGKYLAALAFLAGITLLTFYMPLLIVVNGKISLGHVLSGYTGLILLGAATLAIGMFATAIAPDQLIAGVVGAVITVALLLFFPLAQELEPPLQAIFRELALHQSHFWPFMRGIVHLKHFVFYIAVSYFFLALAVKTMEAKRWQ
jgi:ABC-2 type transport system permease protein